MLWMGCQSVVVGMQDGKALWMRFNITQNRDSVRLSVTLCGDETAQCIAIKLGTLVFHAKGASHIARLWRLTVC